MNKEKKTENKEEREKKYRGQTNKNLFSVTLEWCRTERRKKFFYFTRKKFFFSMDFRPKFFSNLMFLGPVWVKRLLQSSLKRSFALCKYKDLDPFNVVCILMNLLNLQVIIILLKLIYGGLGWRSLFIIKQEEMHCFLIKIFLYKLKWHFK